MSAPLPEYIALSHGSGGRDMTALLEQMILPEFGGDLAQSNDSALLTLPALQGSDSRLAFTTDAYTVTPLEFPGGDIGKLAVNGTINDLAVAGAIPQYLSCALIIEEGFATATLQRIVASMADAASRAGVQIVTGDTKVVHRGAADGMFITTSGIGVCQGAMLSPTHIAPGDKIVVSGPIGDHGAAILGARGDLLLDIPVQSDCRPLHELCRSLRDAIPSLRCLRDATRGGVAAVCNEFSRAADHRITLAEAAIPVRAPVRAACEMLGLEPLYFANEGTLIAVVADADAARSVKIMSRFPGGEFAAVIGEVISEVGAGVALTTLMGGTRMLDMPAGELLPRIC